MSEVCTDNRFEIIAKAKEALLDSTNIETSPDEMACLNSFLFRCWQMDWLDKYDDSKDVAEVVRCKDCEHKVEYGDGDGWYCDVTNNCLMRDENFYCSYGERKEK